VASRRIGRRAALTSAASASRRTLTTLGLAQTDREQCVTRFCYLLTYPRLLIYEQVSIWRWLNDPAP
jgi:hypothetical protein